MTELQREVLRGAARASLEAFARQYSQASDVGLGDTLARYLDDSGIGPWAVLMLRALTGAADCGCGQRQEQLNQWMRYRR